MHVMVVTSRDLASPSRLASGDSIWRWIQSLTSSAFSVSLQMILTTPMTQGKTDQAVHLPAHLPPVRRHDDYAGSRLLKDFGI
jgi:hypothetical protein